MSLPATSCKSISQDVHTLGESRTGVYSYTVWLYRTPLVFTVDLSAKWDSNEAWIKPNCVELTLDGPCYCDRV